MNLFEISGKISLDGSGALSALSSVTNAAKSAAGVLGSLAGTALKAGGVAAGGVAAAGGAVVKQAVTSYAAAEQLVGGIETLFGDSAAQVQQYAGEAFKTAGFSSNDYMETAMGFSASLKQSLNGDTQAMAEYANMAIIDMSDNANKMGTDMGSIQNAYQGFAKQNYTMLDNLKLGYGGTKSEMERLIQDANKVKEANGEMADLSIESFADVVEAIHIIQTEMGITGTTSQEASDTISGSAASAKAAWQNLMTGVADENADMDKLVDDFVSSGVTAAENLVPRIDTAISGTMQLAQALVPELLGELELKMPELKQGAYSLITEGLNFAGFEVSELDVSTVLDSVFGGIGEVGGTIGTELGKIKNTFVSNLSEIGQTLSDNGIGIKDFFTGLNSTLETVAEPINAGLDTTMKGIDKLTEWATTDGKTLNTVLEEGAKGFEGFSKGLTGFLEATGYLIEGDTEKAGETLTNTLNQTPVGNALTTAWGLLTDPQYTTSKQAYIDRVSRMDSAFDLDYGGRISEALYGTADPDAVERYLDRQEELNDKANQLFARDEAPVLSVEDLDQMFPEEVTEPTITPQIDESYMLEMEAIGDQSQEVQVSVHTVGAETATAEIEGVASATESADGSTVTTEVTASGTETATAEIEETASAADSADGKTVSVTVDASSATTAQAQVQQSAQAMQSAMEFSLAVPPVNTSSLTAAVQAAADTAAQIQQIYSGISLSIPTVGTSGGNGGVSATSEGGAAATAVGTEFYAEGGIMTSPTVFGFNPYTNSRMVGGEREPEAIAPISMLQSYVGEAVAAQNHEQATQFDRMMSMMESLVEMLPGAMRDAMDGMALKTNSREFGRLVKGVRA